MELERSQMSAIKNLLFEQIEKPTGKDEFYKQIITENDKAVKIIQAEKKQFEWLEQLINK